MRKRGDEPRTIPTPLPSTIVRGECSGVPARAVPQSRTTLPEGKQGKAAGGNYVIRGLPIAMERLGSLRRIGEESG